MSRFTLPFAHWQHTVRYFSVAHCPIVSKMSSKLFLLNFIKNTQKNWLQQEKKQLVGKPETYISLFSLKLMANLSIIPIMQTTQSCQQVFCWTQQQNMKQTATSRAGSELRLLVRKVGFKMTLVGWSGDRNVSVRGAKKSKILIFWCSTN